MSSDVIHTSPRGGKHRPGTSPAPPRSKRGPHRARGGKKRGFFRRYWWMFVLVPVVAFLGATATFLYVYAHTEIPAAPPGPQTTFVYDRHGKLITTLHAAVDRTIIPFSDMPEDLRHAVVAAEDKNFYREGGVSPVGIFRAAWQDLIHRSAVQGGSTITQQYVKNVYTNRERTLGRKIKEAVLAIKLDRELSKDEILAKYLNTVYFGNGAYGVQAAAETYWGIPARKLSLLQSATLAGLIPAPTTYDPVANPEAARERRNVVLIQMAEQGYITQAEADRLEDTPISVDERKTQSSPAAYFISYVTGQLLHNYGKTQTFTGGLRVNTTLDWADQEAAENAVASHLPSRTDPRAALVAIDPRTGAVRAMVGGRDFNRVKLNLATQAHRQAGSAFKPFTLAAAMEQGVSPRSTWSGPSSIVIDDPRCLTNGRPWEVHTYADESSGTMDLVSATAGSVNTIFAQLVVDVGPDSVVDAAGRMGIQSPLEAVCSITLGTQDVTPMEMADAYATLAARGLHHSPSGIAVVKGPDGQVLDRPRSKADRALDTNDADLVTYALQRVVTSGTGTAANIGRPVAGKTGTAQDYEDAWFCGYTPQLAACVWVGYPKARRPMHDVEGVTSVVGGTIPAEIWHDFMSQALEGAPVVDFATPDFSKNTKYPPGSGVPSTPTPSPSASPTPSPSPSPSPSPTPSPLPTPTESLPPSPIPSDEPPGR